MGHLNVTQTRRTLPLHHHPDKVLSLPRVRPPSAAAWTAMTDDLILSDDHVAGLLVEEAQHGQGASGSGAFPAERR